ncbi:hypothetical protein GCM10009804_20300 [Kribbella hippodromi]|uniref:Uncharacterized protein n=1 Tax=Kribbella hippodromi TaxID=434347 RepID=A0ABN2CVR5_9ACTN
MAEEPVAEEPVAEEPPVAESVVAEPVVAAVGSGAAKWMVVGSGGGMGGWGRRDWVPEIAGVVRSGARSGGVGCVEGVRGSS